MDLGCQGCYEKVLLYRRREYDLLSLNRRRLSRGQVKWNAQWVLMAGVRMLTWGYETWLTSTRKLEKVPLDAITWIIYPETFILQLNSNFFLKIIHLMGLSSTDIYFNSAFKYIYVAVHPNIKKSNVLSSISSAYYSLLRPLEVWTSKSNFSHPQICPFLLSLRMVSWTTSEINWSQ